MSDMPEEKFYSVAEFSNRYSVSTEGRVYSYKTNKFLSPNPDKKGYPQVCLSHNNKTYSRKVHKLMGDNILNRKNGYVVNHIDGNVSNNNIENLECVTNRENVTHGKTAKKYVGVTYWARTNKWQSRISINGKRILLGYFDTPEQGHDAYKSALIKYDLENKYA